MSEDNTFNEGHKKKPLEETPLNQGSVADATDSSASASATAESAQIASSAKDAVADKAVFAQAATATPAVVNDETKPVKAKAKSKTKTKKSRRWTKIVAGSATAVLAVGVVGAGSLFPPNSADAALSAQVQPLPMGDTVANCAGPTRLISGASQGTDPEFAPDSSDSTAQLTAAVLSNSDGIIPGTVVNSLSAKPVSLFTLAQPPVVSTDSKASSGSTLAPITGAAKAKASVLGSKEISAESVLRSAPIGSAASIAAGAVVVKTSDGDLQGLAAAACQTPSNDLWISGANTTVGRTAVLMLSNSSTSSATVALELFGANGVVTAPGGGAIVVAPGTSRSVVLAGLAPDQERLSIHITSAGAAVSALVQESVLRGLTPGGVEYLQATGAPSSSAILPGVAIGDPSAAVKIAAQSGYQDATSALQVTVPGTADATVEVKAFGAKGQVALPNGGVFTASAGKVSELSLAGLAQGNYSLSVTANTAITSVVRQVAFTKPGEPVDISQATAANRLGANHLLTLPSGVSSTLVFTAPSGEAKIALVPISANGSLGQAKTMTLAAGVTTSIDPLDSLGSGTAAVIVSASGAEVYGSQLLNIKGKADIAALPIAPNAADSRSIRLTTGY